MSYAELLGRYQILRIKGPVLAVCACVLFAVALLAPQTHANTRNQAQVGQKNPETLLIEVYKDLGANRLRDALAKADRLVADYPNFRLGHLVRGDLLLMQTRPVSTFGAISAPDEKLKPLRDEALARLKFLRERPNPDLVPQPVLQLRDDQKNVLVVDAARSRLYVYAHQRGQLKFIRDYYVSQGKFGVNKLKTGDQKTPVGIYYITGHLPDARLPDFYGSGALPINYPNEWDRLNGRTGHGIWLHGTPSDSFSRPPLSSDGCVVLTNPDFAELVESVEIGTTPVVISEKVEFVSGSRRNSDRAMAARLVEAWKHDVESMSISRVTQNYSSKFRSERGESLDTWLRKHHTVAPGVRSLSLKLRGITYFFYPGRDDMIVSTFTQEAIAGKNSSTTRKRQYWLREGTQWKIIYEMNL